MNIEASVDTEILAALAVIITLLGGYGLYLKHKINEIDRRADERELAEERRRGAHPAE